MKSLSVRQPWAWAIIHAGKNIENRKWPTDYQGKLFIHASRSFDDEGYNWLKKRWRKIPGHEPELPDPDDFQTGGYVGIVEVVRCVTTWPGPWFQGPHGLVLKDPFPMEFLPAPGKLGIYNPEGTSLWDPVLRKWWDYYDKKY